MPDGWPGLSYDRWRETCDTLHAHTQLLGNADRLGVAVAVARAEPGRLFSRALADELRWADNRVQKQLKQLETAGLLVALPSVGGERRVYYERIESAFWSAAASLEQEWSVGSDATSNRPR